ncbi:type II secretion system protein GspD [Halarcobacter mediterraneus]|uniref:Type II secretion system protein GspD n=1 Tax=Halarcobacter mediterraneus TaxID=2023153 RepID=A0A4Q1ARL8_9BACT|nr:type II secretion system secretin GspD [Halarcobacter mediterraneus]RXK12175.1 type II secretion system protein GspD [Halarcobacter mediterraneus]
MKLIKVFASLILLVSISYASEEKISVNFKDLQIMQLVKLTSKIIDKNILLTDKIQGKVDFISNKPVTKKELIDILIFVLESKGFTLIQNDNILRIVKLNESAKQNVPVVTNNTKDKYNQMVTQIVSVRNVNVDYTASKVRHLISKNAKLVTNKDSNTLVITDFLNNIQTIKKVVNSMSYGAKKNMDTIVLQNISAVEAKKNLDAIAKSLYDVKVETQKIDIVANKDNNSLVFVGNKKNINYLKNYIKKIDTNDSLIKRVIEVYPLKNVEAVNVIKIIDGIIGKKKYIDENDKPLSSVDEESNSIVIMGPSSEVEYIKILLAQLDKEKAQVYVKARIIELNDNKLDEIGVKYGIFGGNAGSDGLATFSSTLNGGSSIASIPQGFELDIPELSSGLALGASISLLNSDGALDIVSEPSVLAIDNKESSIYVGETISIKTSSTTTDGGNTNDNYQREDVGLTLKVKPRISNDNKVTLEINTILEDVKTTATNSGNADTSKKEVITSAIVNNGESVIIGGLIQDKEEETEDKIPLLGDIPLLGYAFKNTNTNIAKKSLVVIVTPYIVPKSKDLTFVRNQLAKLKALEDRFLEKSLIRLKEEQIKKIQEKRKFKERMKELDEELGNKEKRYVKEDNDELTPSQVQHQKILKEQFGM